MAIQFHQEMKDRDYPTKEPVRNPQQSNEQANPMGQLEKENPFPDPIGLTPRQRIYEGRSASYHGRGTGKRKSVSGSYRIDSETAIRSAAAPRASSEIRQGSCPLCGDKHATENDSYGMSRLSGRTRQLLAPLLARIGITPPSHSFGRRKSPCRQDHLSALNSSSWTAMN